MKNWLWESFRYDFKPSPENFIKYKWRHFVFCKNEDKTITPALYLNNLADEVKNDLTRHKSVNKKSLTLSVIQNILQNPETKGELAVLFESPEISSEDIKRFLEMIARSLPAPRGKSVFEAQSGSFHARTYLIATHLFFELKNDEPQYYALTTDTSALRKFMEDNFKAANLSSRLSKMKGFSYKSILKGKNNDGEKGQLKPQFKQIISHPEIFGANVSKFAQEVFEKDFPES